MRARSSLVLMLIGAAIAVGSYYTGRIAAEGAPKSQPVFYAGLLEHEGKLANGRFIVGLQLSAAEEGDAEQCESRTENVEVSNGRFRVAVADSCVAFMRKHADVWVAVEYVDEAGIKHELPGRNKVGAVPYAMEAEHAVSASSATGALAELTVPRGMISMFAGDCPPGWSEFTALRGRVPRGEPDGNAQALESGGSDDAILVQHSHAAQAEVLQNGEHSHDVTGTALGAGNHSHMQNVTANPGSCPGSGIGRADWDRDTSDLCPYPQTRTEAEGLHEHSLSVSASTEGQHNHSATVTLSESGASPTGANMQAFAEVLFCVKL
jgi:hypothetical protein